MKSKYIRPSNLGVRVPLFQIMVVFLMLDSLHLSEWLRGWVWGFMGLIFLVWIIAFIYERATGTMVDVTEKLEELDREVGILWQNAQPGIRRKGPTPGVSLYGDPR